MVKRFKDKETKLFWETGKSRKIPANVQKRAFNKLKLVLDATDINFLRVPPSNHLEALKGDRAGQHSIRINKQWRICFKFKNMATEIEITDYH